MKFLVCEKYDQEVGGPIHGLSPNLKVGGPVSPCPYHCCAYASECSNGRQWHSLITKLDSDSAVILTLKLSTATVIQQKKY